MGTWRNRLVRYEEYGRTIIGVFEMYHEDNGDISVRSSVPIVALATYANDGQDAVEGIKELLADVLNDIAHDSSILDEEKIRRIGILNRGA